MTDSESLPAATPMADDPIVAEVRAAREAHAAAFGYDFARIVADLRQVEAKERAQGRRVVAPREPASGAAA
ncbi:hypothetical protein BH09GEM1_BH09GEM1_47730 [soil metagenome]